MSSKKKNDQEASLREKYQLLREKKIKEQDKQEKEAKAKLEAQKLETAKKNSGTISNQTSRKESRIQKTLCEKNCTTTIK